MGIKFQFLGTCAADFSPRLKDECANRFDVNARRSSCALLEGRILIDCGVHTLDCLRIAGIPCGSITDIVLTHLHADHFKAANVEAIATAKKEPLRLWVSEEAKLPEMANVEIIRMPKLERLELEDDVFVTGLFANHGQNSAPQHLLFEIDGKRILYATDGGWVVNASYNFLRKQTPTLDMLAIDCTCGDYEGEWRIGEHNSIPMIRLMLPSLKTVGIISDKTEVYCTHIAPSLHKPHDEICETVGEFGAKVAYDGLEVEI